MPSTCAEKGTRIAAADPAFVDGMAAAPDPAEDVVDDRTDGSSRVGVPERRAHAGWSGPLKVHAAVASIAMATPEAASARSLTGTVTALPMRHHVAPATSTTLRASILRAHG